MNHRKNDSLLACPNTAMPFGLGRPFLFTGRGPRLYGLTR